MNFGDWVLVVIGLAFTIPATIFFVWSVIHFLFVDVPNAAVGMWRDVIRPSERWMPKWEERP